MYEIIIDGDNISLEQYFKNIQEQIDEVTKDNKTHITVICQSNLSFKYISKRSIDLSIYCCKSQNKNATDANIIFLAGQRVAQGFEVIIVSNDKIYNEIADNSNISIVGYTPPESEYSKNKLKKKTILQVMQALKNLHDDSYKITLDDLQICFPKHKKLELRKYIESLNVHGIIIDVHDVVCLHTKTN